MGSTGSDKPLRLPGEKRRRIIYVLCCMHLDKSFVQLRGFSPE